MTFEELKLIEPLLRAVREEGYTEPTPIQEKAIPPVLDGRDLLGCAQTGTGKTAAFALPILQNLLKDERPDGRPPIRALVIAPTRELVTQVGESFGAYGRHTGLETTVIYGGVSQQPQVRDLQRGVDIVVATPGRLLDLIEQGYVRLDRVEVFVLDEGDRMLDMGFLPDVRRIAKKVPRKRQTLLFSATIPDDIRRLADSLLTRPVSVSVAPTATPAEGIEQMVYLVDRRDKPSLLIHLLENDEMPRTLVFTRTKRGADKVARRLSRSRFSARAIHGDKSQNEREKTLKDFKNGRVRVLVATDVASRGLDIDDISHVVNYELPEEPGNYVHRIGRTARAGASGEAIAFCDRDECERLLEIERLIHIRIEEVKDHPFRPGNGKAAASSSGSEGAPRAALAAGNRSRRDSGNGRRAGRGSRDNGGSRSRGADRPNDGPKDSREDRYAETGRDRDEGGGKRAPETTEARSRDRRNRTPEEARDRRESGRESGSSSGSRRNGRSRGNGRSRRNSSRRGEARQEGRNTRPAEKADAHDRGGAGGRGRGTRDKTGARAESREEDVSRNGRSRRGGRRRSGGGRGTSNDSDRVAAEPRDRSQARATSAQPREGLIPRIRGVLSRGFLKRDTKPRGE